MNNYIRPDRYIPTAYQKEFKQLSLKENGVYFFTQNNDNQPGTEPETDGIPLGNLDGYQVPTEDRIGKDRIGEEEDAPPASPEPPVKKKHLDPPPGVVKASQLPVKNEWIGTDLRKAVEESFASQNQGADGKPRYANYPKEQKAINGICTMVRNLAGAEREMEAAKLILSEFLKLTQGTDKFWSGQPFTPSGLSPLFDRVVAMARKRRGTGPPKGDDIVAEYERREAEKEAAKA